MKSEFNKDIIMICQILLPECSEQQAIALILFYLYGRKKTALLMGLRNNSVRDYVYRARLRLKKVNGTENVEHLLIKRILQKIHC